MLRLVIWQKHSTSFLHSILVFSESSGQIAAIISANHENSGATLHSQSTIGWIVTWDRTNCRVFCLFVLRTNHRIILSGCQSWEITSHVADGIHSSSPEDTSGMIMILACLQKVSIKISLFNLNIIIIYLDWFSHDFVFNKKEMKQTSEWDQLPGQLAWNATNFINNCRSSVGESPC